MEKLDFTKKIDSLKKKFNLSNSEQLENRDQRMVDFYNASKGNLDLFDGYNCTECNNKGHYMYLLDGYECSRECKCMEIRNTIRNMQRSGLKNFIREYTLDKYEAIEPWQENIKNKARQYLADNTPNWWLINGQSGSGKTHICTAICREYLLKGRVVKYLLWKQDSTILKACVNDYEIYQKKLNAFKNAEILYIDDFLKPVKKDGQIVPPTPADVSLAFEIIDYRKNANLRTIFSSERSLLDLLEIDEATAGRIVEKATKEYILNLGNKKERNYRTKGVFEEIPDELI